MRPGACIHLVARSWWRAGWSWVVLGGPGWLFASHMQTAAQCLHAHANKAKNRQLVARGQAVQLEPGWFWVVFTGGLSCYSKTKTSPYTHHKNYIFIKTFHQHPKTTFGDIMHTQYLNEYIT